MKMLKYLALSIPLAALSSVASAADASKTILSCQETKGNVVVTELPKVMTLSEDASGQLSMTLVQIDSTTESRILLREVPVSEKTCNGYQPCRLFTSDSVQFFINLYSHLDYHPGHLEAQANGQKLSADFHCRQK